MRKGIFGEASLVPSAILTKLRGELVETNELAFMELKSLLYCILDNRYNLY